MYSNLHLGSILLLKALKIPLDLASVRYFNHRIKFGRKIVTNYGIIFQRNNTRLVTVTSLNLRKNSDPY